MQIKNLQKTDESGRSWPEKPLGVDLYSEWMVVKLARCVKHRWKRCKYLEGQSPADTSCAEENENNYAIPIRPIEIDGELNIYPLVFTACQVNKIDSVGPIYMFGETFFSFMMK